MSVDALRGEFDETLRAWDAHVAACGDCLASGQSLCYEGSFLAYELGAVRAEIQAYSRSTYHEAPALSAVRRWALPGVPA